MDNTSKPMHPLNALQVAVLLDELGARLELTGESPFKTRAYQVAAESLRKLDQPLAELIAQRKLKNLDGVGEAIAEKITSLHKSGTHPTLERLREEVSDGLLALLDLPGLGPKKVLRLRDELGIDTPEKLEHAARAGELAAFKGLGAKQIAKLLEQFDFIKLNQGRLRLPEADARLTEAARKLEKVAGVASVYVAGEARRRCETVGDFTLVAVSERPLKETKVFEAAERVQIVPASAAQLGAAWVRATGSPEHVAQLEARAQKLGLSFASEGLLRKGAPVSTPDETTFYQALELAFIEPELREGRGEIERSAKKTQPPLLEPAAYLGSLHNHSTWSDGAHTLEEMAEAARKLGWSYFAITDHSQTPVYANGLKADRVAAQREDVAKLNHGYKEKGLAFRVFHGIESDILEDGALDYPEDVLSKFDVIVASVHSRFDMSKADQTERIVKAIAHPRTLVLGHPTGRLLLRRPEYPLDLEQVLKACAAHGVAVEINANPHRLDLDWRWLERANELKVLVSINPDAHDKEELEYYRYGVSIARKGGVPPERIINTWSLDKLNAHLRQRREKAAK